MRNPHISLEFGRARGCGLAWTSSQQSDTIADHDQYGSKVPQLSYSGPFLNDVERVAASVNGLIRVGRSRVPHSTLASTVALKVIHLCDGCLTQLGSWSIRNMPGFIPSKLLPRLANWGGPARHLGRTVMYYEGQR
jgi:hypothetical protein